MSLNSIVDGGDGLPTPSEKARTVHLFTCESCGRRWANPSMPVSSCGCGGNIVAHEFDPGEYSRIRLFGDPRTASYIDSAADQLENSP